jgi:hypothetical protein
VETVAAVVPEVLRRAALQRRQPSGSVIVRRLEDDRPVGAAVAGLDQAVEAISKIRSANVECGDVTPVTCGGALSLRKCMVAGVFQQNHDS